MKSAFVPFVLIAWSSPTLGSDAFDRYVNPVLAKVPNFEGAKEVQKLTAAQIIDHDRVLPRTSGALLVVKTNEGRWSKLLVHAARQKVSGNTIPILLIERFVTYKEGQERTVHAQGENIRLFNGFLFDLDIGQVVPAEVGGDLRFTAADGKQFTEPLRQAKLYLMLKPLPGLEAEKSEKLVVGDSFEVRYFNGRYKLYDDGRRSGTLTLKVGEDGDVTGGYYSDKDGRRYDVKGKIGAVRHSIQFTVKFPRAEQVFQGWLFTGDAKAITGSSKIQERETGFYAVRSEKD